LHRFSGEWILRILAGLDVLGKMKPGRGAATPIETRKARALGPSPYSGNSFRPSWPEAPVLDVNLMPLIQQRF
jgi:hypothetical protein